MTFAIGDAVVLIDGDRRIDGQVIVASANGLSLIVQCEAIVGGFVGMIPVFHHDTYYETLSGVPVTIVRRGVP